MVTLKIKRQFIDVQYVTDLEQYVHTKVIKLINIVKNVLSMTNNKKNIKDQEYFQMQHLLSLNNWALLLLKREVIQ